MRFATGCLIAVPLVAILTALFLPRIVCPPDACYKRSDAARSELSTIASGLDQFKLDCGRYPTSEEGLDLLVSPPKECRQPGEGTYLKLSLMNDPWGNPYLYRSRSPSHFILISLGADGKPGGKGEDEDIARRE